MTLDKPISTSREKLLHAMQCESKRFEEFYLWLEKNMPSTFFQEVKQEFIMLIAHNLMGFHLQDYFSQIHLKHVAFVLCLDSADADLRILKNYTMFGIKNYRAFVSSSPPPIQGASSKLRIAIIYFTEAIETVENPYSIERKEQLRSLVKQRNPEVTDEEFERLIEGMNTRFLHALSIERLILALDMFFRAKTRDHCQYEVEFIKDWKEKDLPSFQIVLAWRNTPKHGFLYQLARLIHRHGLVMKRVNATYITPYSRQSILIMALRLHGSDGRAVWEVADIPDFLQELVTMKYFAQSDLIEKTFVDSNLVRGNLGNLLRTLIDFIHQVLVHADVNLYTLANIEEALCRHPEITLKLCEAFEYKFHPNNLNLQKYQQSLDDFSSLVNKLDTGNEANDTRRKNVLQQGMNLVQYTLKTNFYRNNKTSFSFRLDPHYLDYTPFDRKQKFPELPYAVFFIKGMHFLGFHIRFRDLARGGLRTIFPEQAEQMLAERNNVFAEAYGLAYTQQKKNKDIPEGGGKAVIFLDPYERLDSEAKILTKELRTGGFSEEEISVKLKTFLQEQKQEHLYQSQRSFVNSLLTLVNCESDGTLRAKHVIDYYRRPEYLYLGPDENMHNSMIEWIAHHSQKYDYKPGGAFITSKPDKGINHKEYGVTSLGVNVYMHEVLQFLGINPSKDPFTVKMSGGPDGDVAGNQIYNLHRFYRKTAKLIALTDVSGTINDPQGLDLNELVRLFKEGKPIKHYPPEKLSEGGFLLDKYTKRDESTYAQQTLCWRKKNGQAVMDWMSGSDMNRLFQTNVHQTKTDIFVPGGGRPRTLNDTNYKEFLDDNGVPTSRAIVEGANLYLTKNARRALEKLGVLIVKDSSANKGGVICSSFEVLCGLTLSDEELLINKAVLVQEILEALRQRAYDEAKLLLDTHKRTGVFLTDISESISERINTFTDQLLAHLDTFSLSSDERDPLIQCFFNYCLPTLKTRFRERLLEKIPENHKKAIIACYIASRLVYQRGLDWSPSLVDILPILWEDPAFSRYDF